MSSQEKADEGGLRSGRRNIGGKTERKAPGAPRAVVRIARRVDRCSKRRSVWMRADGGSAGRIRAPSKAQGARATAFRVLRTATSAVLQHGKGASAGNERACSKHARRAWL